MRRRTLAMLVLLAAVPAGATQYPGWGDTGWVYESKRECCLGAVRLAQHYSMKACVDSGGEPRPTTGQQRGNCRAEWAQDDDGVMMYRCYGQAAIWCR